MQSVIFYFWCLLSTISLHIFQYRAPTQDQFCFANQNLDHSICSPQVWNPNGKQAGSYAVLFYSTRALFRHSHLLITPSEETQGSDYFGQPENEPPTLQLVDDLLYLLCHRRGVRGKHNQHEYLEACALIKNVHITLISVCLFHPQELNIFRPLHQSVSKMKLMLVTASLCMAHLGPAFSLSKPLEDVWYV